jgi:hypothetical protein
MVRKINMLCRHVGYSTTACTGSPFKGLCIPPTGKLRGVDQIDYHHRYTTHEDWMSSPKNRFTTEGVLLNPIADRRTFLRTSALTAAYFPMPRRNTECLEWSRLS